MVQSTIIFPENADSTPGFARFETLITPKQVNARYLHGVDLRDNKGKLLPKEALEFSIQAAISELEHDLEICITPTQYKSEKHDYKADDYWNWGFVQLRHKPIITVDQFSLNIIPNQQPLVTFPPDWLRIQQMTGQIQIAPVSGSIGTFNIGQVTFLPRLLIFNDTFPNFYEITYTAGFEAGRIPKILNEFIGLTASISILTIAGELVLGAGISATSLGIDGLSQSITSTASAENNAYGARIKLHQMRLNSLRKILRKYYGKTQKFCVV